MTVPITLDPTDPFDRVLIPIVETNRRKRRDYAKDGDPFSNFRETSRLLALPGFGPEEAALFNVLQKLVRLCTLRENGRMDDPANEAVWDTYLDLAVYAVITLGIVDEKTRKKVVAGSGLTIGPHTITYTNGQMTPEDGRR